MKLTHSFAAAALALAIPSQLSAQIIPVLAEDAAKPGFEAGTQTGTTAQTRSEWSMCAAYWFLFHESMKDELFAPEFVENFPDLMQEEPAWGQWSGWLKVIAEDGDLDSQSAFDFMDNYLADNEDDLIEQLELAAAGDPEQLYRYAFNLGTCVYKGD